MEYLKRDLPLVLPFLCRVESGFVVVVVAAVVAVVCLFVAVV
jgi:hypothetical protein